MRSELLQAQGSYFQESVSWRTRGEGRMRRVWRKALVMAGLELKQPRRHPVVQGD